MMKFVLSTIAVVALLSASAIAQESVLLPPASDNDVFSQRQPTPAPSRATYDREETPQQRVHRNAALRAAQRRERMAINARFGYSPSRPPASPMPFMGSPIPSPLMLRAYYTPYPGMAFPRAYSRF